MEQLEKFFLLFVRVVSMLAVVPIFGSRNMPKQLLIFFSLLLSLSLFTIVEGTAIREQKTLVDLVISIGREVIVGLSIGFLVRLIFEAVQFSGEIMGVQIGFGISRVFDPQSGSPVSVVSQYTSILAFLMFLFLDGHHLILLALAKSLEAIPLLGASFTGSLMDKLIQSTTSVFSLSIVIAAPILASMMLTEIALGAVAKAIPQMNVFVLGFPTKIMVGLLLLGMTVTILFEVLRNWVADFRLQINNLVGLFLPG